MSNGVICEAFGKCGSCQLLNVPYEKQLQRKKETIQTLFPGFSVDEVVGMETPLYYRHKVQVAVGKVKGHLVSGNFQTGSHKLIPAAECSLADRTANAIIQDVIRIADRYHMKAYDEDTKQGLLRYILVRKGYRTGEVMVVLVTSEFQFPGRNNFKKELLKLHPEITTLVQNINARTDSMVLADKQDVFYGPGFIYDELLGHRFRISPNSFYQVNPEQTEKLYRIALNAVDLTGRTVLDAYCGTGTIGILASEKAAKVVGVEINAQAVKDARVNARLNKIENITFVQGDAGEFLLDNQVPDVVIMDPPRSGSSEGFLRVIAEAKIPYVVYISCGPETQARDAEYLRQQGYAIEKITPVDLFPMTSHCENIVLLHRKA